jgi:hypothetical protein
MGKVVMGGGGAEEAAANGNVMLNTTRLEALRSGVSGQNVFARDWKRPVKWDLDNNGARRNYRKMRHWMAYEWCKAGDRDVFGYMELLRARLSGK